MLCEKEIAIGRYLCRAYYKGELRPSAAYVAQKGVGGSLPGLPGCIVRTDRAMGLEGLARCIEEVILSAQPMLRDAWTSLLIGDLRWLNWNAKARVMGPPVGELLRCGESCEGVAAEEEGKSVDGSGALRVAEWELYRRVGARFRALFE